MAGGRGVLKAPTANSAAPLFCQQERAWQCNINFHFSPHFFFFSLPQKLTPFNFYTKFIATQNILETAWLLLFSFPSENTFPCESIS